MSDALPQPTAGDHVHLAARTVISAIPYVGSPALELFNAIIGPPLAKRRDAWFESLSARLSELASKTAFDIESLSGNDEFVSIVMEATQTAIKTHNTEKLDALRNGVLNVAFGKAPREEVLGVFMGWIQDLTGWHVKILDLYRHTEARARDVGIDADRIMGGPDMVLLAVFPELREDRETYDRIVTDLSQRGLFTISSLHGTMSGHGVVAKRTTAIADRFLDFIAAP